MSGFLCSMVGATSAVAGPTLPSGVQFQSASSESIDFASLGNRPANSKIWTVSLWFKTNSSLSGNRSIFSSRSPASSNNPPFLVYFNGTTLTGYGQHIDGFKTITYTGPAGGWLTDTWYHLIVKMNGSNSGNTQLWLNGTRISNPAASNNTAYNISDIDRYYIAEHQDTANWFWNGCLAQIYFYAGDIDIDSNITKFYNNGYVNMGTSGTDSGLPSPHIYHTGSTQSDFATRRGSITGTGTVTGTLSTCS